MSAELKPLVEHLTPVKFEVLQEKVESNPWMLVRGRFQMADTKNGNGRIYPRELWERVLNDVETKKKIEGHGMTGVVEHPDSGLTHLMEVSHVIKKLWMQGNEVLGEALILDTVPGIHVQKLFRAGVPVGISSRGRGTSFMRDGAEYVEAQSFKFDTLDFVSTPSVDGACPSIAESLQGPYRMESSMDAKKAEILRLQVRAHEIKESLATADTKLLDKVVMELIEAESKVNTLVGQKPDLKKEADEARAVVASARSKAVEARDQKYAESAVAFQQRAAAAITPAPPAPVPTNTNSGSATLVPAELLSEAMQRIAHLSSRLAEHDMKGTDSSVSGKKYEAAKKLSAALIASVREHEKTLAGEKAKNEKLGKAMASANSLLEAFVARNDEAKIVRRIREAVTDNPRLAPAEPRLRKCKSLAELEEMLETMVNVLSPKSTATKDKKPSVEARVCTGCGHRAQVEESLKDVTCPACGEQKLAPSAKREDKSDGKVAPPKPAFESALPTGRVKSKVKTEDKPESNGRDFLTEHTGDAGVDLARAALRLKNLR